MTQAHSKLSFQFLSAYKGSHDYSVALPAGSKPRLSIRLYREEPSADSQLSAEDFELQVNGAIGFITTGQSELLSLELVAAFNRYCFEEHMSAKTTILANPKLYGDYKVDPFRIVVGGRYDFAAKEWVAFHTVAEICAQAGITFDEAMAGADAQPDLADAA
jgi:hypothetical protein